MKRTNKIMALILTLVMAFTMVSPAFAANDMGVNYTAKLDKNEITVSDQDQTVVMNVTANQAIAVDAIGMGVVAANGITISAINNSELGFTPANVNLTNGLVNYATSDAENMEVNTVVEVTYTIPANTPAGTYELGIQDLVISMDYGTVWEEGGEASVTLTIKEAGCEHDFTAQKATADYLVSAGDCATPAKYYYSCSKCGVAGTETFDGEKDLTKHVGETEVRNAVEATATTDGYTGDTYCKSCDTLLTQGEVIPATGTGDSTTGDTTTGGTTTGGTTTGGTTTGGTTTGGTTTGGTTTGGSTTGGSTTGGETTGGETTNGTGTNVIKPVDPDMYYIDVDGHWCENLIYKWTKLGVINGVGNNKFDPDGLLTRAQAAAIFSRWLALAETADISAFTDVAADAWYADSVAKCYAAGIVKGKAVDKFAPNDYITRAEMFTMLCRALNIAGEKEMNKYFSDADQIPAWAVEYTNALVNHGYVSGMTETTLAPLSNLTRAQMVKLLDNLSNLG